MKEDKLLWSPSDDPFVDAIMDKLRLLALTNALKYESRYVLRDPYKSFVNSIIARVKNESKSVIKAGTILYRGRINPVASCKVLDLEGLNAIDLTGYTKEVPPFSAKEMEPPPDDLATPGRINPEGIPYLYCSDDLDTAGSELRPWKGALITIAEIKINKDIEIVDLTVDSQDDIWQIFHEDFSRLFSVQWPHDLKLNYIPSQYFSEQFKANNFRGIKYKSGFNDGGNNFAIFHREDYEIISTYIVETAYVGFIFNIKL